MIGYKLCHTWPPAIIIRYSFCTFFTVKPPRHNVSFSHSKQHSIYRIHQFCSSSCCMIISAVTVWISLWIRLLSLISSLLINWYLKWFTYSLLMFPRPCGNNVKWGPSYTVSGDGTCPVGHSEDSWDSQSHCGKWVSKRIQNDNVFPFLAC